jgi:hypothetical protein
MNDISIIELIEDAEQGSPEQERETGRQARKQLNALKARITELENALKPFAEKYNYFKGEFGEAIPYSIFTFYVTDAKIAADVLNKSA